MFKASLSSRRPFLQSKYEQEEGGMCKPCLGGVLCRALDTTSPSTYEA